jgi:Uma2 family endonuclease
MDPQRAPGLSRTQAPNQAEWDAMSPEARRRVVDALAPGMTEAEAAPPEGDLHFEAKLAARNALKRFFGGGGRNVYVGSELTVYYPGARRFAPDLLVVFDVEPHPRTKWVVSHEGKGLDFVLEVHYGGDRRKDAEANVRFYAELGIPEYFVFDRARERLYGYRLPSPSARSYAPVVPQTGLYASEVLGLELAVEGGRLRFYNVNAPLLEDAEWIERIGRVADEATSRAEEEARRAEEEARRAEEQARRAEEQARRAEEEARRAEEETRRAEEEARRAEEQARRAERAEARVAELLAELERLKR